MSVKCNTCGTVLLLMSASEEEVKEFSRRHFGDKQPEWHRKKREREDEECKQMARRLLRK